MPSQYLQDLIKFANVDVLQLKHDCLNAHSPLIAQKIMEKTIEILEYLLHHAILESMALSSSSPAPRAAQPAMHAQPVQPAAHVPAYPQHPATPYMAPQPGYAVPPGYRLVPDAAPPAAPPFLPRPGARVEEPAPGSGGQVAEVTITPNGTRIQAPGMPVAVLPPGAPAFTAVPSPAPVHLPPPPQPGVPVGRPGEVVDVYPRATGIPVETAQAIAAASRSQQQPLIDASGARNITDGPVEP